MSRGRKLVELALSCPDEDSSGSESDVISSDNSIADRNYIPSSGDSSTDEEEEDIEMDDIAQPVPITSQAGNIDMEWKPVDILPLEFEYFREGSLPNYEVPDDLTPLDIFEKIISLDVINYIAEETNRYGDSKRAQTPPGGKSSQWIHTDATELRNFFAIVIVMGLNKVPAIHLYWSKNPQFRNEFILSTMPRDRFLAILRNIHFCNNNDPQLNKDVRTYKVQHILDLIIKNFQNCFNPGRNLVVDESMVPFRGRLIFRQYIPNKTHKYGVKLYKLCTIEGYTYNIIIYTGKNAKPVNESHSEAIVNELLSCINPKEGRCLYADNFYSSIPLATKLYDDQIIYCGTLRANRKGIPEIFKTKLKRGEILGQQKGATKIIIWVTNAQF